MIINRDEEQAAYQVAIPPLTKKQTRHHSNWRDSISKELDGMDEYHDIPQQSNYSSSFCIYKVPETMNAPSISHLKYGDDLLVGKSYNAIEFYYKILKSVILLWIILLYYRQILLRNR